ncbi:hypothetical protein ACPCYX_16760 [Pseudomonas fluorescens]|uniref:hypothetical protein n=1 Tax=Pseudomonas fluorescens TaxID=294 RepID=UPI003C1A14B4
MQTMFIDAERIRQLRAECELHGVDYNRARIEATKAGGYIVRLPTPLVPLGEMLTVPATIECRNAVYAEGTMLDWMLRLTRAERQKVRIGRVYSLDQQQINRTPLGDAELAEYRAAATHAARVKKLVDDLAAATQAATAKAAAAKGAANLAERYGLTATAKPVQADTKTDAAVPATSRALQVKNRKQTKVKS